MLGLIDNTMIRDDATWSNDVDYREFVAGYSLTNLKLSSLCACIDRLGHSVSRRHETNSPDKSQIGKTTFLFCKLDRLLGLDIVLAREVSPEKAEATDC